MPARALLALAVVLLAGCGGDDTLRGDVVNFVPTELRTTRCGDGLGQARVIAIGGDRVEIKAGIVYVNDEQAEESYVTTAATESIAPVTVPDEQLYVLGDDRPHSCDSRVWGFLPVANVLPGVR